MTGINNKRNRVAGDGPPRQYLPSFLKLDTIDAEVMRLANLEIEQNGVCDCGTERYPISQGHGLKDYFGEDYLQHLLQHPATDGMDPRDYTVPVSPVIDALQKSLNGMSFYRARMSRLLPGHKAPYHIDTNTSVTCRLQFMIRGSCVWKIKRSGTEEQQRLNAGEIWFCNSGFPHEVVNDQDVDRWVMILDCDYKEIERTFGSIVLEEPRR